MPKKDKIKRHNWPVLFVHWTVAFSTFMLIFSGFGQMPLYKRYMVDKLPGLSWTVNYEITLIIHYIFAALLIFAVAFHIVFHSIKKEFDIIPRRGDLKESYQIIKAMISGGKEPENDKYLAEQRIAYAYIGIMLIILIFTGIVKVIKNLPNITFSTEILIVAATLHNLTAFLLIAGIIGHLAAFIFKANRPLLEGMFTGKIDHEYAKNRHSLWYKRITQSRTER